MEDTQKMLRAIINNQSANKQEVLGKIEELREELVNHKEASKSEHLAIMNRLDNQGKSLAYLEDDAPTNEDFDKLEKRVSKVEKHFASV